MSDDLHLTWSDYSKAHKLKFRDLKAPRSADLPLKLPPKQKLGRLYRLVSKGQKIALVAALALAIITPLTATWLQNTQTNTATQAAQTLPTIKYLVLVDATTNTDFMILDQEEVVLNLADLPPRINIRPEIAGRTTQVTYQTGQELSLTSKFAPYSLAAKEGWQPVLGSETFTVTAMGTNAQLTSSPYTIKLTIR